MAITRAQQYKQMLQKGGRIGLFKGAQADTKEGKAMSPGTTASGGRRDDFRGAPPGRDVVTVSPVQNKYGDETEKRLDTIREDFINEPVTIKKVPFGFPGSGIINLGLNVFQKPLTAGEKITKKFNFDKVAKAGRYKYTDPETGETYTFDQDLALTDPEIFKKASKQLLKDRAENIVDAYGNPITKVGDGPDEIIIPEFAQAPSIMDQIDQETLTPVQQAIADRGIARAFAAEGGIMDLDTGRQMYGLGKLVKKVTRGIKKIVKSPIGKAALLYTGLGGLGSLAGGGTFFGNFASPMSQLKGVGSIFSKGGLDNIMSGLKLGKFVGPPSDRVLEKNMLGKLITSPGAMITAASLLPLFGIGTGDESEEEAQELLRGQGIDIAAIRANPNQYLAPRFAAEGGIMRQQYQEGSKEPVAKKTMPLLDMGGMEKDYREEGGFVPIGRMEKADDVPARLSKNEFVFTADAVRNAGDGDIDKGAEVMYNMMKNLEAGGEVSEESQGLEGARNMFQTSRRLEEVL